MSDEQETRARGLSRAIRPFFDSSIFDTERALFDLTSRSLSPLCKVQTTNEVVTVTFDLPYVEKKNISVTATETTLSVEAKMRKSVTMKFIGGVQRQVEFERYVRHVTLPARVKPDLARATFRNGLLRVKLPVAKKGSKVRIGP